MAVNTAFRCFTPAHFKIGMFEMVFLTAASSCGGCGRPDAVVDAGTGGGASGGMSDGGMSGGNGGSPGVGGGSNEAMLPAAFETCPPSPAGAVAAPVMTTLEVQTATGFQNAMGSLSAVANGTRANREGFASSGVNCISWKDAKQTSRALNLGSYLFDYVMNDNAMRVEATDDAEGHPGFGFVVSHNDKNGNSPLGSAMPAFSVKTTVMAGANHAIHRVTLNYNRDVEGGGNGIVIPVVIEWLVAAGRSHPVWAVNWKTNLATKNAGVSFDTYRMDSRGPYGSIGWDGKTRAQAEAVGRVEWGAGGYRFIAEQAGGIRNSTEWTYNTSDAVNFVKAVPAVSTSLEFGIVQTKRDKYMGYPDFVQGRLVNSTAALYGNACVGNATKMPCADDWPYQMMQNSGPAGEFGPSPTTGKLMAWGTRYGWLGASSIDDFSYANPVNAQGERSYATFISWGKNGSTSPVDDPVAAAKAYADTASFYVTSAVNGGLGSIASLTLNLGSNTTRPLPSSGYNDLYSAFEVIAANGKADVTYTVAAGAQSALVNPMVIFNGAAATAPVITWNGVAQVSGTDYLASYDTAGQRLWVTFLKSIPPGGAGRVGVQ
jgi:hypothetical protein